MALLEAFSIVNKHALYIKISRQKPDVQGTSTAPVQKPAHRAQVINQSSMRHYVLSRRKRPVLEMVSVSIPLLLSLRQASRNQKH